ncbi:MAG: glycosyl transferase family 28 [Chitinophagaceae bacterium]|nr:glycosyl transferase family 28 [Chitinophagaceae bacterium]
MGQPALPAKLKVLVAPLDWGLGHATRCIPVIRELLSAGVEVIIATEGKQQNLLMSEFPQLTFLPLKGYRIKYARTRLTLTASILSQIPKIISAISYERKWLQETIKKYNIGGVISDNRYGLSNSKIHSVILTHQLLIKTPLGKLVDRILQKINYKYINQFDECWVPDDNGSLNLAGKLSHPKILPKIPVTYIGALSRFQLTRKDIQTHYLLVLLSGPEPQRTLLEKKLLHQIREYQQPVFFIRGLPGNTDLPVVPRHVKIVNHLQSFTLQKAIEQATYIVSRCGYSTLMDVMALQKKSILIPTPGQTEQEYLAQHAMNNGVALCIPQYKFKLKNALNLADNFNYRIDEFSSEKKVSVAVNALLTQLRKK